MQSSTNPRNSWDWCLFELGTNCKPLMELIGSQVLLGNLLELGSKHSISPTSLSIPCNPNRHSSLRLWPGRLRFCIRWITRPFCLSWTSLQDRLWWRLEQEVDHSPVLFLKFLGTMADFTPFNSINKERKSQNNSLRIWTKPMWLPAGEMLLQMGSRSKALILKQMLCSWMCQTLGQLLPMPKMSLRNVIMF